MEDPVIERYEDALQRVRDLELRAERDPEVRLVTVMSEVRAIRDDILAERRDQIKRAEAIEARLNHLQATKVDSNPNAARAFWITLSATAGGFVSLIVWLVQGAGGS